MTTSRTPRAASSRANASPAIPAPTMTTSARRRRGAGVEQRAEGRTRHQPASRSPGSDATRSPRRTGRSGGRAVGMVVVADEARERLQAVLALARTGQGTGPALDQLGVGVAGGHLGPDLPGADVLAEADDRAAGDAPRRVRVGRHHGWRLAGSERPRPVPRRRRARRPQPRRDGRSPGPNPPRPGPDRPIGRRPDREQRRHARPTGRIEHRDEDVVAAADGGTRREDEIEVRAAVGEDDEVDIEPSRRRRRPGRRPRSRARGRRPRRAHRPGSVR